VAAARAAGLRTVWMNRRAHPWPRELPFPDMTVSDCAQLAAVLCRDPPQDIRSV